MDNLQHIDELLRKASQAPANALVNDADWVVVERRLKQRKNRIYAVWFFLALISAGSLGLFFGSLPQTNSKIPLTSEAEINLNKGEKSIQNLPKSVVSQTDIKEKKYRIEKVSNSGKEKITAYTDTIVFGTANHLVSDRDNIREQEYTESIQKQGDLKEYQYSTYETIVLTSKKSFADEIYEDSDTPFRVKRLVKSMESLPIETYFVDASSSTTQKSNYWEFGVSFTPGLSNKLISENSLLSGLINRNYNEAVANSESSSFANTFGFNVQYHAKSWFLATGIFRTQRGEKVNYNYQITESVFETDQKTLDYIPLDPAAYEWVVYSGSNSYHFLEIPLNVGYKMSVSRNFEVRSQLGVSYMALLNREGKIGSFKTLQLQDIKDLQFNPHNIAANVKTGVYWTNSHFALGVEPVFGVNLNTLRSAETSAIKTKPYGYGINITSSIKLFKR